MKVCFFMQRNFAKMAYAIALILKEKYDVDEFCAFVQAKKAENFIKNNNLVKFTSLLFDQELHKKAEREVLDKNYINDIENELGIPNLWPYILVDRALMMNFPKEEYSYQSAYTHEQLLSFLQVKFKAINDFLDKEKPDFVVFSAIAGMSTLIMYELAKKKGIKTLVLEPTRIENYITITESAHVNFTHMEELLRKIKDGRHISHNREKAKEIIRSYRDNPQPRVWSKIRRNKFPIMMWVEFVGFIKYIRTYYVEKRYEDYLEQHPIHYFKNRIKHGVKRLVGFKNLFGKFDPNEDFVFFPLHQEPELSTMLAAPYFTDQVSLIKNVAKALPATFKLYVKDHAVMAYLRPKNYYQSLKEMPNVVLLHQDMKSTEIIPHAKAVITITGTAGLEAALLKIPVVTFGKVFYNALSFVNNISDPTQLAALLKDILNKSKHNEEELVNFIAAMLDTSFPFEYFKLWHESNLTDIKNSKEFNDFVDFLAKVMKL